MLIDLIAFLVASVIITSILFFLPLHMQKRNVIKIAIISSLLALLSYILFTLYSLIVSSVTLLVVLAVFSFVLGKIFFERKSFEEYEEEDTQIDEMEDRSLPVVEERVSPSERMEQETIDQMLKDALQNSKENNNEALDVNNEDSQIETIDEEIINSPVNSKIEDEIEEAEQENLEEQSDDVFGDLEDMEEIIQNRPRGSLLMDDSGEEESLLSHAEVHQDDEEEPLLGRQFADIEEDALPPRPSAFDEESLSLDTEMDDTSSPLLATEFTDDEEEGLPPRPSAFELGKSEFNSNATPKEDLDEESPYIEREISLEEELKDRTLPDLHDEISSSLEPEELKDELELNVRSYLEVENELLERKGLEGKKEVVNEKQATDDDTDGIMSKRSEMFEKLEHSLFDDKK